MKEPGKLKPPKSFYVIFFIFSWAVLTLIVAVLFQIPWNVVSIVLTEIAHTTWQMISALLFILWSAISNKYSLISLPIAIAFMVWFCRDEIKTIIGELKEKQEIACNLRKSKRLNQKNWDKLRVNKDNLTKEACLDFVNGKHLTDIEEKTVEIE